MTFRTRLLLAQLPLVGALSLVGAASLRTVSSLGRGSEAILADNYRSALAAQRMVAEIDRLDRDALLRLAGQSAADPSDARDRFEAELRLQSSNITEAGEASATQRLRAAWEDYRRAEVALVEAAEPLAFYVGPLQRASAEVRAAAEGIQALNQAAMVAKSAAARRSADRLLWFMAAVTLAALALGLVASAALTSSTLGELLGAQQAVQAAIDALPDPVLVLDVRGTVVNLNHAAHTLLGSGRERPGDPLPALDPTLRQRLDMVRAQVLEGKGPYVPRGLEEATRIDLPDGPRRLLPRATALHGSDGAVNGAAVVLQDVTRLVRIDELRNDLVSTIAHEFRTPLTSLQMAVLLCSEGTAGPLTEEQSDLLDDARHDCERLQALVEDILDLSRIQGGRMAVDARPTDVEALIVHAVAATEAATRAKRIALAVERQETPLVLADRDRIGVVLGNLLGNAVRHTLAHGRIVVRAARDGPSVRFEVRDSGPGIEPEHRERIFERFYQVPGTKSDGAGLGLYIARQIVEAHGGSIGVESGPEPGSTFWFTLPTAPAGRT